MSLRRRVIAPALSHLLQLLWPARCAGCDALVAGDAAVFCAGCAPAVSPVPWPCPGCALPRSAPPPTDAAGAGAGCTPCARGQFLFWGAFAAFEYGEAVATAIIRMKHGDRPDLARRLAPLLADTLGAAIGAGEAAPADAVVPVPLHPRKLRRRGFNQALALARETLKLVGPAGRGRPRPRLERGLLVRVKDTAELGRAGRGARLRAVAGAFAVTDPARVACRRFVILDDVMTSGATLNECARTLLDAGAADVRVVALARALS